MAFHYYIDSCTISLHLQMCGLDIKHVISYGNSEMLSKAQNIVRDYLHPLNSLTNKCV